MVEEGRSTEDGTRKSPGGVECLTGRRGAALNGPCRDGTGVEDGAMLD